MFKFNFPEALFAAAVISTLGLSTPNVSLAQDIGQFTTYDAESAIKVDTTPYREILSGLTVSERGRNLVAYEAAHIQALPFFARYSDYLASVPVERLNRDEQLAYWLNTRNFLLIQALSEEGRVRGFKKKRGTPSEPGDFWTEKRITVSGVPLSLHDIEHDILLSAWDDPNIIFGLYQGMTGGPVLPSEPFKAETVHTALKESGQRFNAFQGNFRVRNDRVRISTYYDWYLPLAYGRDEAALREHLSSFAKPEHQALVRTDGELSRSKLSTEFEFYRPRQQENGTGSRPVTRGYGS
jgi:hypothetical protein